MSATSPPTTTVSVISRVVLLAPRLVVPELHRTHNNSSSSNQSGSLCNKKVTCYRRVYHNNQTINPSKERKKDGKTPRLTPCCQLWLNDWALSMPFLLPPKLPLFLLWLKFPFLLPKLPRLPPLWWNCRGRQREEPGDEAQITDKQTKTRSTQVPTLLKT